MNACLCPADDFYEDTEFDELKIRIWPCPCGTEWLPQIVKIARGQRFLRIQFQCHICRSSFGRIYDAVEEGYVKPPAWPARVRRDWLADLFRDSDLSEREQFLKRNRQNTHIDLHQAWLELARLSGQCRSS
jgi:hypothetical protein